MWSWSSVVWSKFGHRGIRSPVSCLEDFSKRICSAVSSVIKAAETAPQLLARLCVDCLVATCDFLSMKQSLKLLRHERFFDRLCLYVYNFTSVSLCLFSLENLWFTCGLEANFFSISETHSSFLAEVLHHQFPNFFPDNLSLKFSFDSLSLVVFFLRKTSFATFL